jgi:hypothetical protein
MSVTSERESVMNAVKQELELSVENLFFSDVQDEALEAIGSPARDAIVYTLAMCTGNAECPF